MRNLLPLKILCTATAAFLALAGHSHAVDYAWTGSTSTWSLNSNWNPATGFPNSNADNAIFTTNGDTTPTVSTGTTIVKNLTYNGNTNFTITGAGAATSTLRIDPNSSAGLFLITAFSGAWTNQSFSDVTLKIDNSSPPPSQQKFRMGAGKSITINSDAALEIAAGNNILVETNNGLGAGTLNINGGLTAGSATTLKADSGGVINLNFNAGTGLGNLGLLAAAGGIVNFAVGGDYGGNFARTDINDGRFNLSSSGITVSNRTLTFNSGAANTGVNGTLGATYLSGTSTFSGNVVFADPNSLAKTNTIDVATGATLALSGTFSGGDSSLLSVDKTGAGTLLLNRAAGNSFAAAGVTVSAGTLLITNTSNSALGTVPITVAAGATLGGTGTLDGVATINGIIAPGLSIGELTVGNDLTWNGAAAGGAATDWKFELGAGNTADLLSLTGLGSDFLRDAGDPVFRFDFQASTATGTFKLVDWEGTTNFAFTDFSYTNLGGGHTGTFQFNGTQLEFIAVVPEPTTWALITLGGVITLTMRRRRFC